MSELRFGIIGAGFWAGYQLSAWREVRGAHCVAVCDHAAGKAESFAERFGIETHYRDAEEMFRRERLDFVDIITNVEAHSVLTLLAVRHGLPVICQKPLAPNLDEARELVSACRSAGVPLLVHENWRWQAPIRALKRVMAEAPIGRVFRARVVYTNSFPVFDNQPFLKELKQFILTDMGTHILDAARFLFGDFAALCCRTAKTRPDIEGEDAATLLMESRSGVSVVCEIGYAGYPREDRFPETLVKVEGAAGSVELGPDYWIHVTTPKERYARRHPPAYYSWAEPAYLLVQSSIVACNTNLLYALQGKEAAETTGADNLKTLELVFRAYDSASTNRMVLLSQEPTESGG
jgi:D-apiose dehydrogenase